MSIDRKEAIQSMKKQKSYAAPHKGLRNILGQFSLLAGNTDYHSMEEVQQLKSLGNELFFLLGHHLHTENEDLLALIESKVPGSSKQDLDDHEVLEEQQNELQKALNALDGTQDEESGHQFYLAFTHFHSAYLAHIYQEEKITEELLMEHFTADELNENSARIMQKVDFTVLLLSLKYIIPAQSPAENAELFAHLREAPENLKSALIDVLETQVSPELLHSYSVQLNSSLV